MYAVLLFKEFSNYHYYVITVCVVLQPVYNSPDLVSPGNLRYLSLDILWT